MISGVNAAVVSAATEAAAVLERPIAGGDWLPPSVPRSRARTEGPAGPALPVHHAGTASVAKIKDVLAGRAALAEAVGAGRGGTRAGSRLLRVEQRW